MATRFDIMEFARRKFLLKVKIQKDVTVERFERGGSSFTKVPAGTQFPWSYPESCEPGAVICIDTQFLVGTPEEMNNGAILCGQLYWYPTKVQCEVVSVMRK